MLQPFDQAAREGRGLKPIAQHQAAVGAWLDADRDIGEEGRVLVHAFVLSGPGCAGEGGFASPWPSRPAAGYGKAPVAVIAIGGVCRFRCRRECVWTRSSNSALPISPSNRSAPSPPAPRGPSWPRAATSRARVARSAGHVEAILKREGVIYGVTTGYGDSCTTEVAPDLVAQMPLQLSRYHGCGLGPHPDAGGGPAR